MAAKGAEKEEDELPPGFRFHPTDEELLAHYLVKKIADISFTGRAITDADLNKCEPWDLPAKAKMGEKEWYFFSLRDRKYPTGVRTNRATNAGYWKTTGKDKEIFSGSSMSSSSSSSSHLLGMKKTLVFYRGRAPRGEKSNWVMHEYRIHSRSSLRTPKEEWVVCRIFQKNDVGKKEIPYNLRADTSLLSHSTVKTVTSGGNYNAITDFTEISAMRRNGHAVHNVGFSLLPTSKNFTISGLNLNLGRHQNYYSPALSQRSPIAPVHQGDAIFAAPATYCAQQQGFDGRAMTCVEQCLDLDAYWPAY